MIFAMNEHYELVGAWECRDDFVPGFNDYQQERDSLPNGVYYSVWGELLDKDDPNKNYGPAYGSFYITSNDPRGRDIHGGGSASPDPFADYQGWYPTLGCLRMQNANGRELVQMMIDSGNRLTLTVVD